MDSNKTDATFMQLAQELNSTAGVIKQIAQEYASPIHSISEDGLLPSGVPYDMEAIFTEQKKQREKFLAAADAMIETEKTVQVLTLALEEDRAHEKKKRIQRIIMEILIGIIIAVASSIITSFFQ